MGLIGGGGGWVTDFAFPLNLISCKQRRISEVSYYRRLAAEGDTGLLEGGILHYREAELEGEVRRNGGGRNYSGISVVLRNS